MIIENYVLFKIDLAVKSYIKINKLIYLHIIEKVNCNFVKLTTLSFTDASFILSQFIFNLLYFVLYLIYLVSNDPPLAIGSGRLIYSPVVLSIT